MLVTFIIVAYNAENVLKDSLKCLKEQIYDHKNIEVILVDSNSNDNTKKYMEEFKNNNTDFNRIIVLDNINKTLPYGWNVALKESKGEAIVRVDAHSTFPNDFIKNNVMELEEGEDIVGGHRISICNPDNSLTRLLLVAEESLFGSGIAKYRRNKKREYVSTLAHAMYRKKVFDKVGLYNVKLARTEDNEMHYRMRKAGYKFLLSPNITSNQYPRNSFNAMIKQKYENGKWIGITLKYCPKCFSMYHFAPMMFVLSVIFSLLFIFISNIPIILLFSMYGIFNILNIINISIKKGFKLQYFLLPIILLILHFAYGIGTIVGIIKGEKSE